MANDFSKNSVFQGLGTDTTKVPNTGAYTVSGKISLPSIPAGSPSSSALVTTINVNGSPIYTGSPGARGFRVIANCTAADIITIVFSSSAPVDLESNVIKSNISISQES